MCGHLRHIPASAPGFPSPAPAPADGRGLRHLQITASGAGTPVTLPLARPVMGTQREIFIRTTIKYPILRRQTIFTGIGIMLLNIGWCGTLLSLPHWNFCRPLLLLPLIRLQFNPSTGAKLNRWNIVTVLHKYILDMDHENTDLF